MLLPLCYSILDDFARALDEVLKQMAEVAKVIVRDLIIVKVWTRDDGCLNSWKQWNAVLLEELRFPIHAATEGTTPRHGSTNGQALEALAASTT